MFRENRKALYDFVQASNPSYRKYRLVHAGSHDIAQEFPQNPSNQCSIHPPKSQILRCCGACSSLFDLVLKVLAGDQIWDVIIIIIVVLLIFTTFLLLHGLVALSQLSEGGKGVGAELVEDTGDEFSELLVLTVSVDGEGVGWDGGVDCGR